MYWIGSSLIFQLGSLALEQLRGCWLYLDNLSVELCLCWLMAGETGPRSSVIQTTACFQTQHVFHICSEDNSSILNSSKLYYGTDCSDFPDFLVNGCSAAHKVITKGSQAAFCVKPLWFIPYRNIPYINIPWCKPQNYFHFQCVLNTLIICFYSFLPGWLLSSFSLSVFRLVWANLTTFLKLILEGEKSINH